MAISLLYTTTKNKPEAEKIMNTLLSERLIACANIFSPITSLYHWEGTMQREEEYPVLLKTRTDLVDKTMERLAQLHPYDTPCIVVLPTEKAYPSFVKWIFSNTRD